MRALKLVEPRVRGQHSEEVLLLVAHSEDEGWGELEPLRETTWANGIKVISGELLSNALHGHLRPLLTALGWEVQARARKVSEEEGHCALHGKTCLLWDAGLCRPGGRRGKEHGPPQCYEPPLAPGTDPAIVKVFREVALAWRDGRHVIVVQGPEFSLR